MDDCLGLSQIATVSDHADLRMLYQVAFGEAKAEGHRSVAGESEFLKQHGPDKLLQHIIQEISPEAVAREVLLPIDTARASYILDAVTVENYSEFIDVISSFHAHILRHQGRLAGTARDESITKDALNLVKRSFKDDGGEKAAYDEAMTGTKGGLRYVFDMMVKRYRIEERETHIEMVLDTAIDILDPSARTRLIASIMDHLGSALPRDIRSIPPGKFVKNYELILRAYAESIDELTRTMKLL